MLHKPESHTLLDKLTGLVRSSKPVTRPNTQRGLQASKQKYLQCLYLQTDVSGHETLLKCPFFLELKTCSNTSFPNKHTLSEMALGYFGKGHPGVDIFRDSKIFNEMSKSRRTASFKTIFVFYSGIHGSS